MQQPANRRRRQHGVTLVESMITLLVTVVAIGAAAPGLQEARAKRHLDGTAAQLANDLRHARSLAVAQSRPVRFSLHHAPAGSCYVAHTGPVSACSCNEQGQAQCTGGAQALLVAGFPASGPVRLSHTSASMLFEPDRGTVTPTGTVRAELADGRSVRQIINVMGRVRTCSPDGPASGHPAC
jgi:type IV fimbrial biogenesis protein FimT